MEIEALFKIPGKLLYKRACVFTKCYKRADNYINNIIFSSDVDINRRQKISNNGTRIAIQTKRVVFTKCAGKKLIY